LEHRPCVEFIRGRQDIFGRRSRAEFSDEFNYNDEQPLKKLSRCNKSFQQDDYVVHDRFENFLPNERKMQDLETIHQKDFVGGNRFEIFESDNQKMHDSQIMGTMETMSLDNFIECDKFKKFLPDDSKIQKCSSAKTPEIIYRGGCFNDDGFHRLPIARGLKVFDSRLQIDDKLKSLNNKGWEIKLSDKSSKLFYTLHLGVLQNLNVPEHVLKKLNMLECVLDELNKKIGNNLSDKNEFIDQLKFGVLINNSENLISKKINIIGACVACKELNKCGTMEMSIDFFEEIQILHVTINYKKDKKKMKIIDLGKFTNNKTNFKEILFQIEAQFQMLMMQQKTPSGSHLVRFIFPYVTGNHSEIEIKEIKKKTECALFTCIKKFSKCAKYVYHLTDKTFAVELIPDGSFPSIETVSATSQENKLPYNVSEEKLTIQTKSIINPLLHGYQTVDDGSVFYSYGIIDYDDKKGYMLEKIEFLKNVSVQFLIHKSCYYKDKIIKTWCSTIYGIITRFPIIENYGDDYYLVQFTNKKKSEKMQYIACLGLYIGEKKSVNFKKMRSADIASECEYGYEKTKSELLQRYFANTQVLDKTKKIYNVRLIVKNTSCQKSYKIIVAILKNIAEILEIDLNLKEIIEIIDEYIIISIKTDIMSRYAYFCQNK
jgi:hypothetical protein